MIRNLLFVVVVLGAGCVVLPGQNLVPNSKAASHLMRVSSAGPVGPLAGGYAPRPVAGPSFPSRPSAPSAMGGERGVASYYSSELQGRPTASGEPYNEGELTAAHRTLAFGTRVTVTRLDDGRSVTVRINDRGPHKAGRVVDLSRAAAERIGLLRDGVTQVVVRVEGMIGMAPTQGGGTGPEPSSARPPVAMGWNNGGGAMMLRPAPPSVPAAGPLAVEVRLYGSLQDAGAHLARLDEAGMRNLRIQQVPTGGRPIYRLLAVGFSTPEAAGAFCQELEARGLAQ